MFRLKLLLFFMAIILLSSCVTTKNFTYLQEKGSLDTIRYQSLDQISPEVATIQPDDIIGIIVSSLNEESNELFNFSNLNSITMSNFSGIGGVPKNQPLGYLIDPMGNIYMPLVGKINLMGLTLEEASNLIKDKLNGFLKEPTVSVRMLNHKFTVLGEVNRPGVYNLLDNHTTLLDVLGMSGDLTIFGRRDNLMLIRTTNRKREVVKINLTDRNLINSPYFFIQNNDMVYVETLKGKITSTDRTIQLIPIVTGVASTFILLMSLVFKK